MTKKILNCRRSTIAMFAIACLTALGLTKGIDVSLAITGIVASIAGANSYQASAEAKAQSTQQIEGPTS